MSTLEDRLEQDRDWVSWVPGGDEEKFDTRNPVIGKVVDQAEVNTDFGLSKILILETDDGKRLGVWLNRTVLKNEVIRANPQWGERIGIKYLGSQTPKSGGRDFHNYTVRVDRPLESRTDKPSWGDGNSDGLGDDGVRVNPGYEQPQQAAPQAQAPPVAADPADDIPF